MPTVHFYLVFVSAILLLPVSLRADEEAPSLDLDGYQYVALVKVDNSGAVSKGGNITLPYYLALVHYADRKEFYGALVRTVFSYPEGAPADDSPEGFRLQHLYLAGGKVKGEKKLVSRLMNGTEVVAKKVIAKIKDSGETLLTKVKKPTDPSQANYKLEFERIEPRQCNVLFGNLSAGKSAPPAKAVTVGNTVIGFQMTDSAWEVSAPGKPVGWFSTATLTLDKPSTPLSFSGQLVYAPFDNKYWGTSADQTQYVAVSATRTKKGWQTKVYYTNPTIRLDGYITIMGGNQKAPSFKPLDVTVIRVDGHRASVSIDPPHNLTQGFVARLGDAYPDICLSSSYIDSNGIAWFEIDFGSSTFEGPVQIILENPDGSYVTTTINVPPYQQ